MGRRIGWNGGREFVGCGVNDKDGGRDFTSKLDGFLGFWGKR